MSRILNLAEQQAKEVRREVNRLCGYGSRWSTPAKTKLIWEVYAGAGRITECAQQAGARVERFGLLDGWDFSKSSHRRALIQKAAQDEPDDIFMSPRCTLWSPMQNINIKDEQDERELDHDTHLKMSRLLYLGQVRRGQHAHIEHPERSKAWSTSAFKTLPGYHAVFDQCANGATTTDDNGYDAFIRKSTALHTTKHAMAISHWKVAFLAPEFPDVVWLKTTA